jgi:hypothetical protein
MDHLTDIVISHAADASSMQSLLRILLSSDDWKQILEARSKGPQMLIEECGTITPAEQNCLLFLSFLETILKYAYLQDDFQEPQIMEQVLTNLDPSLHSRIEGKKQRILDDFRVKVTLFVNQAFASTRIQEQEVKLTSNLLHFLFGSNKISSFYDLTLHYANVLKNHVETEKGCSLAQLIAYTKVMTTITCVVDSDPCASKQVNTSGKILFNIMCKYKISQSKAIRSILSFVFRFCNVEKAITYAQDIISAYCGKEHKIQMDDDTALNGMKSVIDFYTLKLSEQVVVASIGNVIEPIVQDEQLANDNALVKKLDKLVHKLCKHVTRDCKLLRKVIKQDTDDVEEKCEFYQEMCILLAKVIKRFGTTISTSKAKQPAMYKNVILASEKIMLEIRRLYRQLQKMGLGESLESWVVQEIENLAEEEEEEERHVRKRKLDQMREKSSAKRTRTNTLRSKNWYIDENLEGEDDSDDAFVDLEEFIELE